MLLLVGSLSFGITVFLVARMVLAYGDARWRAEQTARKADVLHPAAADRKRTLLGVTGHAFAWINRQPIMQSYLGVIRRDNIAAGDPWDLSEQEILQLSELLFVGVALLAFVGFFLAYGTFNF